MIDRFGNCPHCKKSWRGKDILQELKRLDVFSHVSEKGLIQMASRYGYHPEQPIDFSIVNIYFTDDGVFFQCPSLRCGHVFNANTEEEYESIWHLKKGKLYVKEEEEDIT